MIGTYCPVDVGICNVRGRVICSHPVHMKSQAPDDSFCFELASFSRDTRPPPKRTLKSANSFTISTAVHRFSASGLAELSATTSEATVAQAAACVQAGQYRKDLPSCGWRWLLARSDVLLSYEQPATILIGRHDRTSMLTCHGPLQC